MCIYAGNSSKSLHVSIYYLYYIIMFMLKLYLYYIDIILIHTLMYVSANTSILEPALNSIKFIAGDLNRQSAQVVISESLFTPCCLLKFSWIGPQWCRETPVSMHQIVVVFQYNFLKRLQQAVGTSSDLRITPYCLLKSPAEIWQTEKKIQRLGYLYIIWYYYLENNNILNNVWNYLSIY